MSCSQFARSSGRRTVTVWLIWQKCIRAQDKCQVPSRARKVRNADEYFPRSNDRTLLRRYQSSIQRAKSAERQARMPVEPIVQQLNSVESLDERFEELLELHLGDEMAAARRQSNFRAWAAYVHRTYVAHDFHNHVR